MRAGTTCKNAACKAVSTWQGPIFARSVLLWLEALQVQRGSLSPSCHQLQGRVLGGWEVAVPISSVCFYSSRPWTGCLCHLPAMFLQEASRFLDWWYICVPLLLIACNEM